MRLEVPAGGYVMVVAASRTAWSCLRRCQERCSATATEIRGRQLHARTRPGLTGVTCDRRAAGLEPDLRVPVPERRVPREREEQTQTRNRSPRDVEIQPAEQPQQNRFAEQPQENVPPRRDRSIDGDDGHRHRSHRR